MEPDALELTFDDGPDPRWTPALLDALAAAGLRASFFVVAPRAAAHPELVAATVAAGHAVELHCGAHLRPAEQSREALEADTADALALLAGVGVRPRRWRTPWGLVGPWTRPLARRHRLALTGWTVDSHDWRGDAAAAMLAAVAPAVAPGAVVLMHDGLGPGAGRTGCAETVRLVGLLAEALAGRGLRATVPGPGPLPAGPFPPPRGGSAPVAGAGPTAVGGLAA